VHIVVPLELNRICMPRKWIPFLIASSLEPDRGDNVETHSNHS